MASNGKKGSGNAAPTQNEQKKQTAEKKNDAVQHETEQQPVPNISVRIDKLFDDNVDTYFPNLDKDPNWEVSTCTEAREYKGIPYAFLTYDRVWN